MKTNLKIFQSVTITALLVFTSSIFATDYYLSNTGNDRNKGTSPETAWLTISKLNTTKLKPGEKILFQKGDTFTGEVLLGSSGTLNRYYIQFL